MLQGGRNDRDEPTERFDRAVRQTLVLVGDRFPHSRRLILGPGPDSMPVTRDQLEIDRRLVLIAAENGVACTSMLQERWITPTDHAWAVDPTNHHPTVAGQRYLGHRLAASIRQHFPQLTPSLRL